MNYSNEIDIEQQEPTLSVLGTTELVIKNLRVVVTWVEQDEAMKDGLLDELVKRHNRCWAFLVHQFGKEIRTSGVALMASVETFSLN